MATDFTDDELRELYGVLNNCQRVLKYQEQAEAARSLLDKPDPYSPLVTRLMGIRNLVGDKVAQLPAPSE